jgi:hypothetical protein
MLRQATHVLPARPHTARHFRDRRWLDETRRMIAAAGFRADATRNITHLAELVAAYSDGRTMRSRPGMALLQELSGLGRATCQRWLRWLERSGALLVVEGGTTPQFAPDRLRRGDPNLAREWHLILPSLLSEAPPPPEAYAPSRAHANCAPATGEGQVMEDRRSAPGSALTPPRWPAPASDWQLGKTPQRRREALTAVQALQRHHMVLRRLSARRLRSIVRPWFRSGWLPCDVLWALDRTPDGPAHWHADRVRDPASWLEHRLGFWLDSGGQPVRSHSAVLAGQAAAHRDEIRAQQQDRQVAGQRSAGVDVAAHAAAARAMLRERAALR